MMPCILSDCVECKHFIGHGDAKGLFKCIAFPNGIPQEYMWGKVNAAELHECKSGIKFEPIQTSDAKI